MGSPMSERSIVTWARRLQSTGWWWLLAALVATCLIYAPGLSGGFLFDDYPNIVDNPGVQPHDARIGSLVGAALSSPASEFKRPLASLSFAANYLATGLDPYWMKLTNLVIHLIDGLLVFLLARMLLALTGKQSQRGTLAAWIAGAWMVLPINLTGVLYVVQRMESLANTFVLLGLLGYVAGRRWMQAQPVMATRYWILTWCTASLVVPTGLGMLAKETAVLLPLYAAAVEWTLLGFRRADGRYDPGIITLFLLVLALPLAAGLAWLLPSVLAPASWATRDFTLDTRLLTEARVVAGYIAWTIAPLPGELSFYHDTVRISQDLLRPLDTLVGLLVLLALLVVCLTQRRRQPLVSLGIALFLSCHLLTGTILPLELVYEHRNYFASFGLLLVLVPLLAGKSVPAIDKSSLMSARRSIAGQTVLGLLAAWWIGLTAYTAYAWGEPLRLARELAERTPDSPRAQYELGRTYIIYSHYRPASPYTQMAYVSLERAATLPGSSILPQQALIFMNARMQRPLKGAWWSSMIAKLKSRPPGVQDESSLAALVQCARERWCGLPPARMIDAFQAALSHPNPSARLLANYGDYAWNVLQDRDLGIQMTEEASAAAPSEVAYHITLARMYLAEENYTLARTQVKVIQLLNIGGRLNDVLRTLEDELPHNAETAQPTPLN